MIHKAELLSAAQVRTTTDEERGDNLHSENCPPPRTARQDRVIEEAADIKLPLLTRYDELKYSSEPRIKTKSHQIISTFELETVYRINTCP